jgi:hypothetical protein
MAFLYAAVKSPKGLPSQKEQWPMLLQCPVKLASGKLEILSRGLNAI